MSKLGAQKAIKDMKKGADTTNTDAMQTYFRGKFRKKFQVFDNLAASHAGIKCQKLLAFGLFEPLCAN